MSESDKAWADIWAKVDEARRESEDTAARFEALGIGWTWFPLDFSLFLPPGVYEYVRYDA